jgi:hypothetical protein
VICEGWCCCGTGAIACVRLCGCAYVACVVVGRCVCARVFVRAVDDENEDVVSVELCVSAWAYLGVCDVDEYGGSVVLAAFGSCVCTCRCEVVDDAAARGDVCVPE